MKTGLEIHHGKFSGTFVCPHRNLGFICVSVVASHSTWLLFWEDVKGNWSGVVVRSEAEGPKLREGQGKKKRAQSSMRNKECWNEKSLGWGKGRALWKGSCGYQGKGEGGPEMCFQAPQPSTNVLQNENKSCLSYKMKTSHVWRSLFTQVEWNETVVSIWAEEMLNRCTSAQEVLEPWSDSFHRGHAPWTAS